MLHDEASRPLTPTAVVGSIDIGSDTFTWAVLFQRQRIAVPRDQRSRQGSSYALLYRLSPFEGELVPSRLCKQRLKTLGSEKSKFFSATSFAKRGARYSRLNVRRSSGKSVRGNIRRPEAVLISHKTTITNRFPSEVVVSWEKSSGRKPWMWLPSSSNFPDYYRLLFLVCASSSKRLSKPCEVAYVIL